MSIVSKGISWWEPQIGEEERSIILEVLDGNFLNDGEYTTRFEKKLADTLNCRHAVAVTNGTTALFLALVGSGISPGDEVIVPDLTFIATANAVVLAGAKPVLVDIEDETLNISPQRIEQAITSKTKAIIPVHVSGRPADMNSILSIAAKHDLIVIEDAAEALSSKLNGRYLGTFGGAGIISFSPNKTITTGQGGVILLNDDTLEVRLRELKDQGRPVRGTGGEDTHNKIGYNFKLTNLQAAIGIAQLSNLSARIARMKLNYLQYLDKLKDIEELIFLPFNIEEGEVPQWVDVLSPRRNELIEYLKKRNIICKKFWFPLHRNKPYLLPDENFPNSTRLSANAFWLPSCFSITDAELDLVCKHIREFFGKIKV
jgi:perosamine synthetase